MPASSLRIFTAALATAWLLGGCAKTPTRDLSSPDRARGWHDAVDWTKAGDEAIGVLRGYLRVDTTNPPGHETRGAEYLASVLAKDGIASEILEHAPGRGNLIARLDGTGEEKPLCLLSHIDVVTAEASTWAKGKGPLSGALDERGMIWGRGALDMKGLGALEVMTMVLLKRANVPLKRSVILLAVAAEETDSAGIRFIVDEHWGKIGCSHAINEGGIGLIGLLDEAQTVYTISVGEKGVLWLKMTAHGEAGHGSTPVPGRAPQRLIAAVNRIEARDPEPVVHETIYELAARAGEDIGGLKGSILRRPFFVDLFVVPKLMENPPARATLIDTCNLTGFQGRKEEPNVVPSELSAILDCRVLPGTTPQALLAKLKSLVDDPQVTFTVLEQVEARENTWDDPLFHALARSAVDGRAHVVAGPVLSPGYTDSLYLRPKGVHAYGFVPFEVTREELTGYHGKNERVSSENVRRGLRALYRAVVDVSAR